MNKQELQNEITKTKEHLANMEKMLAECEYERWKPEPFKQYWFVNSRGQSVSTFLEPAKNNDTKRLETFNCFETEEQAESEAEKILFRRMLEDIARRLNKCEKIDWNDEKHEKYCLTYDNESQCIYQDSSLYIVRQGTVYCIDENFKDVAIQEIGEERLKKYLRGE